MSVTLSSGRMWAMKLTRCFSCLTPNAHRSNIVHASDISSAAHTFDFCSNWSRRLAQEFANQVELERQMGLPQTSFMVDNSEKAICVREKGFIDFIV